MSEAAQPVTLCNGSGRKLIQGGGKGLGCVAEESGVIIRFGGEGFSLGLVGFLRGESFRLLLGLYQVSSLKQSHYRF